MFALFQPQSFDSMTLICLLILAIKIYTLVYAHSHPLVEGESLACALQRWGHWDTFTTAVDLNLAIWIMDILLVSRYYDHVQKFSI